LYEGIRDQHSSACSHRPGANEIIYGADAPQPALDYLLLVLHTVPDSLTPTHIAAGIKP